MNVLYISQKKLVPNLSQENINKDCSRKTAFDYIINVHNFFFFKFILFQYNRNDYLRHNLDKNIKNFCN